MTLVVVVLGSVPIAKVAVFPAKVYVLSCTTDPISVEEGTEVMDDNIVEVILLSWIELEFPDNPTVILDTVLPTLD